MADGELRLTGRSGSHFTRVARMTAHELGVPFEFDVVHDLLSLEPAAYGGHPALKLPTLHIGETALFGTENICRKLSELAGGDRRIVLPEHVTADLARSAQELVWHAMALQVQLLVGIRFSKLPSDNVFFAKATAGMLGSLTWLEQHLARVLDHLPAREVSVFEVALFCLVEHVAWRPTVPLDAFPSLRGFAATFATRASATRTVFRADPPPVAYRAATAEDASGIAALHAASWRRTYRGVFRESFLADADVERRTTWNRRIASPPDDQLVILGTAQGRVCGFICAYANADADWGVFIDNLHVEEAFQNSGVGTALLLEAARWACAKRPDARPYLWVLEPNVRAARFYEARGAIRAESLLRENPGGGTATYLRYAWETPSQMAASCTRRSPRIPPL